MFQGCKSLESLDVSSFDTSNVTDMAAMFEGCDSLKELDISNFDTSNVKYFNNFMPNELNPNWRNRFGQKWIAADYRKREKSIRKWEIGTGRNQVIWKKVTFNVWGNTYTDHQTIHVIQDSDTVPIINDQLEYPFLAIDVLKDDLIVFFDYGKRPIRYQVKQN